MRTISGWVKNRDKLLNFEGSGRRATTGGQGRRESLPFAPELAAHMEMVRDKEEVRHLVA